MPSNSMAAQKAPSNPPVSGPKNPIPGPAEIAASAIPEVFFPEPKYYPPSRRDKFLKKARSQHPLIRNLTEKRHEELLITPQIAKAILENWNRMNRPFSARIFRNYTEDMLEGRFRPDNGLTIGFDVNGDLTDGQHRLGALVRSGKMFRFLVVSGLPLEARDTIDIGLVRTLGQVLAMHGVAHAEAAGRAARLMIVYERHDLSFDTYNISADVQPSKAEIEAYVYSHSEELSQAVIFALDRTYKNPFIKATGVNAFLALLLQRQDPQMAKLFFYQLANGLKSPADPSGLDAGHPVLILRETFFRVRSGPKALIMSHSIGYVLKTWIAVRTGKVIKHLSVKTTEAFPYLD